MRRVILALGAGGLIEGLFAWMFVGSSWGPCGPGTPLGLVGLLAHLFPGALVAVAIESSGGGKDIANIGAFGSQWLFWVVLSWLALTAYAARRRVGGTW